MNKLQALESNILITSELSSSVKELIAQEHHDAAALLTNKLCLYVEKSQKLLQEYKEELLTKQLAETARAAEEVTNTEFNLYTETVVTDPAPTQPEITLP